MKHDILFLILIIAYIVVGIAVTYVVVNTLKLGVM